MIDIDELERLETQATKGPWMPGWGAGEPVSEDDKSTDLGIVAFGLGGICMLSKIPTGHSRTWQQMEKNAHLIVALRNAAPDLISELREARAWIAQQPCNMCGWDRCQCCEDEPDAGLTPCDCGATCEPCRARKATTK